jgi:hypothetical protein
MLVRTLHGANNRSSFYQRGARSVTLFLFCARAENDDRDRNAAVASSQTRVVASRFDERSFSSRRAFQTTPTSRFFFFAF